MAPNYEAQVDSTRLKKSDRLNALDTIRMTVSKSITLDNCLIESMVKPTSLIKEFAKCVDGSQLT